MLFKLFSHLSLTGLGANVFGLFCFGFFFPSKWKGRYWCGSEIAMYEYFWEKTSAILRLVVDLQVLKVEHNKKISARSWVAFWDQGDTDLGSVGVVVIWRMEQIFMRPVCIRTKWKVLCFKWQQIRKSRILKQIASCFVQAEEGSEMWGKPKKSEVN